MSNSLIKKDVFDNYKTNKQLMINTRNVISNTIQKETHHEMENIKQAINKYNNKVESILNRDDMKSQQQIMEQSKKQMQLSLFQVEQMFMSAVNKIDTRTDLNAIQKNHYKKQLFDKMIERLYSKEDIQKFKNMFGNIIMVIPQKSLPIINKPSITN